MCLILPFQMAANTLYIVASSFLAIIYTTKSCHLYTWNCLDGWKLNKPISRCQKTESYSTIKIRLGKFVYWTHFSAIVMSDVKNTILNILKETFFKVFFDYLWNLRNFKLLSVQLVFHWIKALSSGSSIIIWCVKCLWVFFQ